MSCNLTEENAGCNYGLSGPDAGGKIKVPSAEREPKAIRGSFSLVKYRSGQK